MRQSWKQRIFLNPRSAQAEKIINMEAREAFAKNMEATQKEDKYIKINGFGINLEAEQQKPCCQVSLKSSHALHCFEHLFSTNMEVEVFNRRTQIPCFQRSRMVSFPFVAKKFLIPS